MVDHSDDLASALDAFYLEHIMCVHGLDGGVDDHGPANYTLWMTCLCGARLARHCADDDAR